VRAADEGTGRYPVFDSPDVYSAWRRTPTLRWTVAIGVPASLVDVPLRRSVWRIALAGLVAYIAAFAIGLGPVFWLMISEIFPVGVRGSAMAACTIANWGANFLVAQTFLTLSGAITRQGVFFLYAALAVFAVWFFATRVPETSGRSLEDIQEDLTAG